MRGCSKGVQRVGVGVVLPHRLGLFVVVGGLAADVAERNSSENHASGCSGTVTSTLELQTN